MAQQSRDERKKMFAEIMESLNEYSTQEINDPESAKAEILQLLKTHRAVKRSDYEYALSRNLKENHRLIIKEPEDGTKVREFLKHSRNNFGWYCTRRLSPRPFKCHAQFLQIEYGIVFAPIVHHYNCKPSEYSLAKVNDLLKRGKPLEALGFVMNERRSANRSQLTSMLNESILSYANGDGNSILTEAVSSNATNVSVNSSSKRASPNITENAVESARSSVTHEIDDDDEEECLILNEPAAKKPKIENDSVTAEPFEFYRPSSNDIKQVCKKLNIDGNNNAYKLWGDIVFQSIPSNSNNIQTHPFKTQNIFACLSLLFSGKNDGCFLIQHVINTAFRDDLMNSGSKTNDEIDQMLINNIASNEQIEFIAKFLGCRIGIFENGRLKKYGKWNKKDGDALNLILSFDAGVFSLVLDLQ